jgi:hypothetical protein
MFSWNRSSNHPAVRRKNRSLDQKSPSFPLYQRGTKGNFSDSYEPALIEPIGSGPRRSQILSRYEIKRKLVDQWGDGWGS